MASFKMSRGHSTIIAPRLLWRWFTELQGGSNCKLLQSRCMTYQRLCQKPISTGSERESRAGKASASGSGFGTPTHCPSPTHNHINGTRRSVSSAAGPDRSPKSGLKSKQVRDKLKIESQPPEDRVCDWVGPADQDSNLRPVNFFIPKDESPAEQRLREMREDTQRWNQEHWSMHNQHFIQMKELYIQEKQAAQLDGRNEDAPARLTAEEMSVFYKRFLDENYDMHKVYNREWYRRNLTILWLSIGVTARNYFLSRRKR